MKVLNPNWQKISSTPVEISLRSTVGVAVEKEELSRISEIAADLFARCDEFEERIEKTLEEFLFNIGTAERAGADYILSSLASKSAQRKANSKK